MRKSDIDTPALILDLDIVERNIASMAAYFRDRPQKLRPHFKTPKTPEIARRQLAAGAIGITVAKLGEAEVLARAGLGPILIANQVVGPIKIDRLLAVAARVDVIATVESEFNVRELEEGSARAGRSVDVIIEVDTGMHRCGAESPEEAVALARRIGRGPRALPWHHGLGGTPSCFPIAAGAKHRAEAYDKQLRPGIAQRGLKRRARAGLGP